MGICPGFSFRWMILCWHDSVSVPGEAACYELIWHRTFSPTGIVAFLPNSRAGVEFCSWIAALGS